VPRIILETVKPVRPNFVNCIVAPGGKTGTSRQSTLNDDDHHCLLTAMRMSIINVKRPLFADQDGGRRLRLTKEQVEQNRRRIVETASRMFRLRGLENVAVADVMKESGFTHGGFYNHFKSKDALAAEAVSSAFDHAAKNLSEEIASGNDPQKALSAFLADYLSPAHRDTRAGGCPAPAFPVDVARGGKDVQMAFAEGVEAYLEILAARLDGDKREARQRAVALLSGIVGALLLSRAVKNGQPRLSDELLNSARKQICKPRSK
jgi:TetR/AcrR family transcriptional repressor of nem operon